MSCASAADIDKPSQCWSPVIFGEINVPAALGKKKLLQLFLVMLKSKLTILRYPVGDSRPIDKIKEG